MEGMSYVNDDNDNWGACSPFVSIGMAKSIVLTNHRCSQLRLEGPSFAGKSLVLLGGHCEAKVALVSFSTCS
jgi:hypothetical protein